MCYTTTNKKVESTDIGCNMGNNTLSESQTQSTTVYDSFSMKCTEKANPDRKQTSRDLRPGVRTGSDCKWAQESLPNGWKYPESESWKQLRNCYFSKNHSIIHFDLK